MASDDERGWQNQDEIEGAASVFDASAGVGADPGAGMYAGDGRLSALEASVLDEYVRLQRNLDKLAAQLEELSAKPSVGISDTLRLLERKTALVHTALKSSVYSIVLSAQEEGVS